MRILILATDIYTRGGIARYTATLAEALSPLPASVDVLPLLGDAGADAAASVQTRGFAAGLAERLSLSGEKLIENSGFAAGPESRRLSVRQTAKPLPADAMVSRRPEAHRIFTPTTGRLTAAAKIRHTLRALRQARRGCDLVICSHLGQAPVAALIRLRYGTPYLVVAHGSEAWVRLPAIKRLAVRGAHTVLAVSAYTARTMARVNGIPSARIKVIYNAIPDQLVRALMSEAHHPWIPSSARRGDPICRIPVGSMLLSVASLKREHKYKGVDTVIGALPQILAALPEVRYVVAGAGEDRARLERMALSLGVRDRVTFAGEVSDEELANLYRACAVFVLPSRASKGTSKRLLISSFGGAGGDDESRVSRVFTSRFLNALGIARPGKGSQETSGNEGRSEGAAQGEGFGRVYVEAALAGKPVVGSIDGGAAEAVIDGRTGLLVDPRSAEQVTGAVIRLLESPDWAARLGAEGRRRALEQFTVGAMRNALEAVVWCVVRGPWSVVRGVSPGCVRPQSSDCHPLTTDNGPLTTDC